MKRPDISELNMTPYVQFLDKMYPQVYNLYGVSVKRLIMQNHFGGLNGGHYTAIIKHPHQNNWHCLDDSRVSECRESEIRVIPLI
jgi:ubiquitin C-terminal hydrolase